MIPTSRPETVHSIQVLRGLAALAVVLFHARGLLNQPDWALGDQLFIFGHAGVDLFFMISGFIIVYATPQYESVRTFALKRFLRVWPLYVISTFFVLLLIGPIGWQMLRSLAKAALFLPTTNDTPPAFGYAALLVGWTLTYEVIFYLVFAMSLWAKKFRVAAASATIALTVLGGQILAGGPLSIEPHNSPLLSHQYLSMAINPLMLEFIVGMVIAELYRAYKPHSAFALTVGSAIFSFGVWKVYSVGWAGHGITLVGFGCVFIVLGGLGMEPLAKRSWMRPLQVLGDWSYALYLIHIPVLTIIAGTAINSNRPVVAFLINIVLVLLSGWLFHVWIEAPILRRGRQVIQKLSSHGPLTEFKQAILPS